MGLCIFKIPIWWNGIYYKEEQCDGVRIQKYKKQNKTRLHIFQMQKGDWPPAHYPDTAMTQEGMKGWRDGSALTALERSGFSSQEPPSSGLHRLSCTHMVHINPYRLPCTHIKKNQVFCERKEILGRLKTEKERKKATNPSPTTTEMRSRGTVTPRAWQGRSAEHSP